MSEFGKLKKAIEKANKIYELAGGKKENLKNAILQGKGNEDKAVPLSGLEGLGAVAEYTDEFERFILESDPGLVEDYLDEEIEGLGVVASTAIAAASAAVGSVAALLSKITGVFDKAKNAKTQVQSLIRIPQKPSAPVVTQPVAQSYTAPKVTQPFRQSYTAPGTSSTTLQVRSPTVTRTNIPGTTALQTTATQSTVTQPLQRFMDDSTLTLPPEKPSPAEEQSWVQKNKTSLMVGAGVAVAAGGILYAVKKRKSRKSKPVSGIPAKKKIKVKAKAGTAKQKSKAGSPSVKAKSAKASKNSGKRRQSGKQNRLAPKVLL